VKESRACAAALVALDRFESTGVWEQVIARVGKLSPRLRVHAVDLLIKRPASAKQLLEAIRGKSVAVSDVDASQAEQLRHSCQRRSRAAARGSFCPPPAPRSTCCRVIQPHDHDERRCGAGKKIYQERLCVVSSSEGEGFRCGPTW
jgi:hypothetical protein